MKDGEAVDGIQSSVLTPSRLEIYENTTWSLSIRGINLLRGLVVKNLTEVEKSEETDEWIDIDEDDAQGL